MTTHDAKSEQTAKIEEYPLEFQSPFSWDMPEIALPVDTYIGNQLQRCQETEEEHQFQWTRFVTHLIVSYEVCDKKQDYTQALEHIKWCRDHRNSLLLENCKESLFCSLQEVLIHVILATEAHILLAAGHAEKAKKRLEKLSNNCQGDVKHLRSTKNRAGLLGLKAAAYLQYQGNAFGRALSAAEAARDLDPDQAEWWFIVGISLGRIRRLGRIFTGPNSKEIEAIEKSFALQKDATYTVHLGQVYADYSSFYYLNDKEKSMTYAVKANDRFREALQLRPNCINLKGRVAHGMLWMPCKKAIDIRLVKELLDEVMETVPDRLRLLCDLGYFYATFEKDYEKAIFYNEQAYESGGSRNIIYLAQLKWKCGVGEQIKGDVVHGLQRHLRQEDQSLLNTYLGVCHALKHDWKEAITCFKKALDLDPSAQCMTIFKDFTGRTVNLLEIITNHLSFYAAEENWEMVESFLAKVTERKPQDIVLTKKKHIF